MLRARSSNLIRPELFDDPAYGSLRRLLWYAFMTVNLRVLEQVGDMELNPPHVTALRNMDMDGTRISTMAERAGVTKQAMGMVVQDMERWGYVEVRRDPADGRARRVTYTDRGRALVQRFIEADQVVEEELMAILGAGALKGLKRDLKTLVAPPEMPNR